MGAQERDELVKKILSKGPKTFKEIQDEVDFSPGRTDRALKSLKAYGEIIHDEKWYALPEHLDKLQEKVRGLYETKVGAQPLYTARREHTKELRHVLARLRDELKNDPRIQSWPKWESPNWVIHRNFTDQWMFNHLRSHIPELMKKWDYYQKKLRRQAEIGWNLIPELGEKIANDLGINFVYGINSRGLGVHLSFPEFVLRTLSRLVEGSIWKEKVAEKLFADARNKAGEIRCLQNGYAYMIVTAKPFHYEILAITLPKVTNVEEKKKEIDNYKRELLDELRSSESIMNELKRHSELSNELFDKREEITKEIDKYCAFLVLPGICEIIKEAVSKHTRE